MKKINLGSELIKAIKEAVDYEQNKVKLLEMCDHEPVFYYWSGHKCSKCKEPLQQKFVVEKK